MIDQTQFDVLHAILESIRNAAQPDVQACDSVVRLADAALSVMTKLPVEDINDS